MKIFVAILILVLTVNNSSAQILKKIKQKAEDAVTKPKDKTDENKQSGDKEKTTTAEQGNTGDIKTGTANLKVYSKFDFVPGNTILYYDNFEKDNIGESPLGWITSTSAEVVTQISKDVARYHLYVQVSRPLKLTSIMTLQTHGLLRRVPELLDMAHVVTV